MKKLKLLFVAISLIASYSLTAQVAVNADGSNADGSAMLEVKSTDKGFLPPRMTETQRDAITPAEGLIIYNTTTKKPNYYNGIEWMNYNGTSAESTVPDAPTIGAAVAGNAQATVAFTSPENDGGSMITEYTATSTPGGFTGTITQAGSGTITVTGLTNGTAYTFTVTATNAIGTSAASAASNLVTPAIAVPDAPTIGTATIGYTQATVAYTAPANNGGSTITSYTATSNPGGFTGTLTQAGSGIITVTGLSNGTSYTFTVTATNAIGTSAASEASNPVTPAIAVPDAPTIGTATCGDAQASVPFTAPANNGGSTITSYTATSNPGSFTGTLTQAGSGTITVTGLTNSTSYTFTVTATNAIGTSTASAASNSVTPEPFSCGDALIDGRNNQSYTTVEIGGQCWMAENLNIGTQINSADGGTNSDGQQTDNNILEKYCVYNDESNCDAYGGLYQWDEIMQYVTTEGTQGICPIGWHLPTDDEWKTMEMELGMTQEQADLEEIYRGTDQGGKMKSTSGWDDFGSPSEDGNGTNTSGFTALPGGDCAHGSSLFLNSGNTGYFWSSSEKSDIESWARRLISASDGVYRYGREKEYGFSVRCLKD